MTKQLATTNTQITKAKPSSKSDLVLTRFLGKYAGLSQRTMVRYLAMIVDLVNPPAATTKRSADETTQCVRGFDWSSLNYDAALRVKRLIEDRQYAPSTCAGLFTAIRSIANEMWELELLDEKQLRRIQNLKLKRGSREKSGKLLSPEHLSKMLKACHKDKSLMGLRDAALLAILYGAGLRRAEAASLKISDLDFDKDSITVIGKGNKQRTVFCVKGVMALVCQWLDAWENEQADHELFPRFSTRTDVPISGKAMTGQSVYVIVRRRALEAGIPVPSPHSFRHSFITTSLKYSDVFIVQRQAGHSNVNTTRGYDQRGKEEQASAAQKWGLPT